MLWYKRILTIITFCLLAVSTLNAQVKKSSKSSTFTVPRVSRGKARVVCPIFKISKYPYQGFGFKIGDPFAFTYKFYFSPQWAVTGDVGIAASGLYSRYYKNLFESYIPDKLNENQVFSYITHKVSLDLFFEIKLLRHWNLDRFFKGLQIYTGVGVQSRSTQLSYNYAYIENRLLSDQGRLIFFNTTSVTYGGTGVLGFEYAYFSFPLAAFMEIEVFVDALASPGYTTPQGGIGLRYIF